MHGFYNNAISSTNIEAVTPERLSFILLLVFEPNSGTATIKNWGSTTAWFYVML